MFEERVYFDTNAVQIIWDKFTEFKKEANSDLEISETPFKNSFLSAYTIDELLITLSNKYSANNKYGEQTD